MLESNNIINFNGLANSSSYHTFLLDEERSRLYVGAKDHILSFNLVNIKEYQKVCSLMFCTVQLYTYNVAALLLLWLRWALYELWSKCLDVKNTITTQTFADSMKIDL